MTYREEQLDLFGDTNEVQQPQEPLPTNKNKQTEPSAAFKDCTVASELRPEPFFAIWVDALAQDKSVRRGRTRHTSISA